MQVRLMTHPRMLVSELCLLLASKSSSRVENERPSPLLSPFRRVHSEGRILPSLSVELGVLRSSSELDAF